MSEEITDRRQKAAKEAKRQVRLAEEMKANMRKRKSQGKALKAKALEQTPAKDDGELGRA